MLGWLKAAENILFPPRCLFCGELCDDAGIKYICGNCLVNLDMPDCAQCARCGCVLPRSNCLCGRCDYSGLPYSRAHHAYQLCEKTRYLVHQFKYGKNFEAAHAMADLMSKKGILSMISSDIIVPVPMYITDKLRKGFNHSGVLAGMVSAITGIPVVNALVKVKSIPHQAGLSRKKRIENVKNVFTSTKPEKITGKKALLLDDIYTTGSTLNECAAALREAGVRDVEVMTFAVTSADNVC
ncbi:MAG: ComF family protein [bacterium]|nr:ComF family protein [bacterium]